MERKILYDGKFLTLWHEQGWEFVQRKNCSGIVVILAMTEDKKVLFTEQYRIPLGKNVVEFPAGLVNDLASEVDESFEEAASRELLEETGYEAGRMEHLVTGPVSSGMCCEIIAFFRAHELVRKSAGGGIGEFEQIRVHEVSLEDIPQWLDRVGRSGLLIDPKVYAGLYWLHEGKK